MKKTTLLITTVFFLTSFYSLGAQAKPQKHSLKRARRYRFDGFRLEDSYNKVQSKKTYSKPCDDDPVDNGRRKAMVYGGLPCRGHSFPDNTTVVFLLEMKKSQARPFHAPIKAFAFMGGRYFVSKTKFPIHPGDSTTKAKKILGSPKAVRTLGKRHLILEVWRYRKDIRLLVSNSNVVGAVFGDMPKSLENEQWEVIYEMYRRYTPKEKTKLKKTSNGSAAKHYSPIRIEVQRWCHKSLLATPMV